MYDYNHLCCVYTVYTNTEDYKQTKIDNVPSSHIHTYMYMHATVWVCSYA
jgi:hypothetical protein